jgi:hypothetical protein
LAIPAEAEVDRLAKEDALDAVEFARQPARQQWPVASLVDPTERDGWPQTKVHGRWWQRADEHWPDALWENYRAALLRELTEANFALVEQRSVGPGQQWTSLAVVDLERWQPTFDFTPGQLVQQDYGSSAGWRHRSLWRRMRSRPKQV